MIQGKDIYFRTHNFGDLMGSVTKQELTPKQQEELKDLLLKIQLTEKQAHTRDKLVAKRDSEPELDATAKTHVQEIFRRVVRNTHKHNFENKYTKKGNLVEDSAINRIAKVNGWGVFLNANKLGIELKDNIGVGHPDAYKEGVLGFDAKASYSDDTFPLFQTELKDRNYIWQDKRLAMMAGLDCWYTCYSLENTPEDIIIQEAKKEWYSSGLFDEHGHLFNNDIDLNPIGKKQSSYLNDIYEKHNFDHLADWERVKTFKIELSSEDVKLIKKRAEMARNYFDDLVEQYKQLKR